MDTEIQDQGRREQLQPDREVYAIDKLTKAGIEISHVDKVKVQFMFKGHIVTHFFYTGWHTGKTIKDGRGIHELIKQVTLK